MMKKILFICGSLNQTTQMHKIAMQLMNQYECYFTPYYADGFINFLAKLGWLDFTVLGGRHRRETDAYLSKNNLRLDLRGENNRYDLIVTCSDLIMQKNLKGKRIVLVQEGITEPEGWVYKLVRLFNLPRYLANTATNGLSNAYDIFCVASEGYAEHFIRKGVKPEKIAVTGIPNFDDMESFCKNNFPFKNYVLVATTPYRETFRFDNRIKFIKHCVAIAGDRLLIFKLHPMEKTQRAIREIHQHAPNAFVFAHGNVSEMIANASVVITQQSTCTFVAMALKKEVHTYLNIAELKKLMPIQNGATSAKHIASICEYVLHQPVHEKIKIRAKARRRVVSQQP